MKTLKFKQEILRTGAYVKRIIRSTKGCGQMSSNYTYFSDVWFIVLKTSEEAISEGVDHCGPVKTIQKGF